MQAVYSGDGEWYEATVKGVSDTGDFVVSFDAYEHEESVHTLPHLVLSVFVCCRCHPTSAVPLACWNCLYRSSQRHWTEKDVHCSWLLPGVRHMFSAGSS